MSLLLALALQAAPHLPPTCAPVPDAALSGLVTYCDVEVHAEPDAVAIATTDSDSLDFGGFAVRYRLGERLDGEWVRQQVIAGAPPASRPATSRSTSGDAPAGSVAGSISTPELT